ncbi:PepSY domain-containing protein [Amnibacterium endophyticum]|uniref:PepSY domain-containing protein n=1 Tax=Amnibacterium endophyticum TaxID=2109337 RepID=A0ABW4LH38_9MICO
MRPPARIALAAVLPAAVLALSACTTPSPLPVLTPSATATPTPTPTTSTRSVTSIAGLALRAVGGTGTVTAVDDESFGTVWDVRVVEEDGSTQELHLGGAGRLLAGPSEVPTSADTMSANRAQVAAASISLADAADRMRAAVPKGRVTAIELTQYRDRVVWQGDVTNADGVRQDVRIDAVNGSVLLNLIDGQRSSGGS